MNRSFLATGLSVIAAAGLVAAGCELETLNPTFPADRPADHIVINEIFTLPQSNPNTYSWLEIYNPTSQTVDMQKWTLSFTTRQQVIIRDTANNTRGYRDSTGRFDVPFQGNIRIPPSSFLTLVNNENRLLTYMEYGPGNGPKIEVGTLVILPPDTIRADSIRLVLYDFALRTSDQLVLKDTTGTAVDVVRYGDYMWSGPGPDPYPSNHSAGVITEYQSLARFAGAYFTGNSADDFYVTGVQVPQTRPIPHYFSQARHP